MWPLIVVFDKISRSLACTIPRVVNSGECLRSASHFISISIASRNLAFSCSISSMRFRSIADVSCLSFSRRCSSITCVFSIKIKSNNVIDRTATRSEVDFEVVPCVRVAVGHHWRSPKYSPLPRRSPPLATLILLPAFPG